ncbi:MAG TPA: hypothetical protein VKB53_11595 [Gammaproteobacteria bacterium]|nr:hypothetical protein [Gammaproteobacteria bacterium]
MSNAKVIPLRSREQAIAERIAKWFGYTPLTTQDILWIIRLVERELQARCKSEKD